MFILCKDKETKDLLNYGFEENVRPWNDSKYYILKNSKGTNIMFYEKKLEVNGLTEEKCKILYELITNGIIENVNVEVNTKEARIKKLKEKIDELNKKLKELEVE